jgi:hypothetical protein
MQCTQQLTADYIKRGAAFNYVVVAVLTQNSKHFSLSKANL